MLPFDILGVIFGYYEETETIIHPLETLLLVCRDWSNAALDHRALWGRLRIYLSHEPSSRVWSVRLPLRLARCGSDLPLDVDLRNGLAGLESGDHEEEGIVDDDVLPPIFRCDQTVKGGLVNPFVALQRLKMSECTCYAAVQNTIKSSLQILSGNNGEKCKRWRTFKLDLGHMATGGGEYSDTLTQVGTTLSFATPNLVSLELRHVFGLPRLSGMNLFPDTSKLEKLILFYSTLPSLPPCKRLRLVSIGPTDTLIQEGDLSPLREADQMRVLSLRSITNGIALPAKLEHLHTLRLGAPIPPTLAGCQMPNVSTLVLVSEDEDNILAQVLTFNNLSLERLVNVTLEWDLSANVNLSSEDELTETLNSVTDFLSKARNLRHIKADQWMMDMILRVLWNSVCTTPPKRHTPERMPDGILFAVGTLTLTNRYDPFTLTGNQDTTVFERLANLWRCTQPQADLWDTFLSPDISE